MDTLSSCVPHSVTPKKNIQFTIMPFTKCRVAHCIYDLTALLLPRVLRRLIEECWHPQAMGRPTFSEIIIRLDKIYAHCAKQGSWKESLKIWFVFRRSKRIKYRSVKSRIHTELWTVMFSKKKDLSFGERAFIFNWKKKRGKHSMTENLLCVALCFPGNDMACTPSLCTYRCKRVSFRGSLSAVKVEEHVACWLFFWYEL